MYKLCSCCSNYSHSQLAITVSDYASWNTRKSCDCTVQHYLRSPRHLYSYVIQAGYMHPIVNISHQSECIAISHHTYTIYAQHLSLKTATAC